MRMRAEHHEDGFRAIDHVTKPDVRWANMHIMEPDGKVRPKTLADHHGVIATFVLNASVPEKVWVHFENARNLLVYAWFAYRFVQVAEAHALASVEMALRDRLGLPESTNLMLKRLLKRAIDDGLIVDDGFRHVQRGRERTAALAPFYEAAGTAKSSSMSIDPQGYAKVLLAHLPELRNRLAHGSTLLHPDGYLTLELCCDLINQLYATTGASAEKPISRISVAAEVNSHPTV